MPRHIGAKNKKNDNLIPIIAEVLPNGEYGWEVIVLAYQDQMKEPTKNDVDDLRRH
jgi:hypothetical protein